MAVQVQQKRTALTGNYAVAEAVKLADVDVIAAYPITPQTTIVEKLAEYVADGIIDAEYIPVESEHSAISACLGASLAGARTFTATASQGLALMHEILFITSVLRAPVVMAIANRSLSAPLSIWNDHSDSMAERDTGWIQIWAANAQEVFDSVLQAYRIAEDRDVLLPVMVNLDGYILSHTVEPVLVPEKKLVEEYLPPKPLWNRLSVKTAYTLGVVGPPEYYFEMKYQAIDAIERSRSKIKEADEVYGEMFGRSYGVMEHHFMDDAEVALIAMGSVAETAYTAIKRWRERGAKVGFVRIRVFRPFPAEELRDLLKGLKVIGILDRATSPGSLGGPAFAEVSTIFVNERQRPLMKNYIAGLGGRDVPFSGFDYMIQRLLEAAEKEEVDELCEYVGLRE